MITGNLTLTDWLLIEHNNGSAAKEIISGVGRVATPVLGKRSPVGDEAISTR